MAGLPESEWQMLKKSVRLLLPIRMHWQYVVSSIKMVKKSMLCLLEAELRMHIDADRSQIKSENPKRQEAKTVVRFQIPVTG